MSDADQVQMSYAEESTFGEPPTGAGPFGPRTNYRNFRFTQENLGQDTTVVRSAEINSDRQTADIIRTVVAGSGNIDFEFSGLDSNHEGNFDDMLIAALLAAEDSAASNFRDGTASDVSSAGDISFNASGSDPGEISDRTAGGVWTDGAVPNGSWIRVSGSESNDGVYKVVDTPDNNTISVVPATLTQDIDDTGVTVEVLPEIIQGTTLRNYTWQRAYTDLSNVFARLPGFAVNQLSLAVATENLITGSLSFLGKNEVSSATDLDASKDDAPDGQVLNNVDHVTDFLENQANFGIINWTTQLSNNLRNRLEVGTLGPISQGKGQVVPTGTLQSYFATAAHFDRALNHTTTSLALAMKGDNGGGYIIDYPAVKLIPGRRVAGGQNSDVIADLTYEAFRKKGATEAPAGGVTVRIAKIPVPA